MMVWWFGSNNQFAGDGTVRSSLASTAGLVALKVAIVFLTRCSNIMHGASCAHPPMAECPAVATNCTQAAKAQHDRARLGTHRPVAAAVSGWLADGSKLQRYSRCPSSQDVTGGCMLPANQAAQTELNTPHTAAFRHAGSAYTHQMNNWPLAGLLWVGINTLWLSKAYNTHPAAQTAHTCT